MKFVITSYSIHYTKLYDEVLGDAVVRPAEYPIEPVLRDRVSAKFLKESRIVPLADTDRGLILAMADPLDGYVIEAIKETRTSSYNFV